MSVTPQAIHVGAAAPRVPDALRQSLRVGGRMIIPVGPANGAQAIVQVDRVKEGSGEDCFNVTELLGVRYVPLVERRE